MGGRLTSGRRWRPALTLWLPVEAARALYLPALAASGGGNGRPTDIWPSLEAGPHALAASGGSQSTLPTCSARQWRRIFWLTRHLAVAGGRPLRSGCQWRQPGHPLPTALDAIGGGHGHAIDALAASGGSQGTLLTALAVTGGHPSALAVGGGSSGLKLAQAAKSESASQINILSL